MKKLLLHCVVVAWIYANVSVMLSPFLGGKQGMPSLPVDFFRIFGVFSRYELTNEETVIEGLREAPAGAREEWVRLDAAEFFPFSRAERERRIRGRFGFGGLRTRDRQSAWNALAEKIRRRHNRTHPGDPVRAIRLVELSWPKSFEGFDAGRGPETTVSRVVFVETLLEEQGE